MLSIKIITIIFFSLGMLNLLVLLAIFSKLKKTTKTFPEQQTQLKQELHFLATGVNAIGKHIAEIEKQLSNLVVKQDELAQRQNVQFESRDNTNYLQAARLMEKGAAIEEVIMACGLSRAEAELLKRLSAQKFSEHIEVETIGAKNSENKLKKSHSRKKTPAIPRPQSGSI